MQNKSDYISNLIPELKREGPVIYLESQMKSHPSSTKSFLAAQPIAWIKAWGDSITISDNSGERDFKADPWDALQKFRDEHNDWLFGYLGYDLKNFIEDITSKNETKNSAPDLFFMIPGLLLQVDDQQNIEILNGELPKSKGSTGKVFEIGGAKTIPKLEHLEKIKSAQQDIYEGAYYEINISHPVECTFSGSGFGLYKAMKQTGPVPFGGYLSFNGIEMCCASPERFLARDGVRVWSQPIKGTALRENGPQADINIQKLKNSEKERAENLMIVDLVRNDLSRVAVKNTVKVSSLFEVQSFETVHQLVSTVECEVEGAQDSIELIKACFPMGSMTGAPKIAAMKAIEAYENYKRGIYSGAMGYLKPNGDFDLNVVIRTAIIEQNKLVYPVGGAITSDSDPDEEWEETLIKARALTNIIPHQK